MCWPAVVDTGTRPDQRLGEASGGRLRHWGRAALEIRRVRRGSARIPLRVIRAETAQARLLGGRPRSLEARQRALFKQPGKRLMRLQDTHFYCNGAQFFHYRLSLVFDFLQDSVQLIRLAS
ncbi:hypothetical protein NDU88_005043 [Pleurodeles waltl]|uniref:Uncharacterized protein n=1 Tax=Pleurodeles waltl TaxID=8319 RepID=A0AAV7NR33_PLEWA|nr:hypothetical protein NDU88_005043 [Pleurodeles waltl]